MLPPICVLAGGLGTRLGAHVRDTPKPLLPVAGQPFILHQLRLLARHGASKIVVCIGYLGEQIIERIGTEQFGMTISYSDDGPEPLGTLGAIRRATPLLGPRFLVLYGDTYLRIEYTAAAMQWEASGLLGMMTVLRNEGRWDTSNVAFDGTRVVGYDKRAPSKDMHWIDYGLGALRSDALGLVAEDCRDIADLYHELANRGELFGYAASERFYEIGTPPALAEADEFLRCSQRARQTTPHLPGDP